MQKTKVGSSSFNRQTVEAEAALYTTVQVAGAFGVEHSTYTQRTTDGGTIIVSKTRRRKQKKTTLESNICIRTAMAHIENSCNIL